MAANLGNRSPGRVVSTSGGVALPTPTRLRGDDVAAVVHDGRGGWYVGGLFTVPSASLRNLVHIARDGSIDPTFAPNPDSGVGALARQGDVLFVGGAFQRIAGHRRKHLAAINLRTARALAWSPRMRGRPPDYPDYDVYIYDLEVYRSVVYVAGDLLAAFDARTAKLLAVPETLDVMALERIGSTLYLGGRFTAVGDHPRAGLAALRLPTNRVLPFAPEIECTCHPPATPHDQHVVVPIGSAPLGPTPPRPANSATIRWPTLRSPEYVDALVSKGTRLFLGGNFDSVGGQQRKFLAAVNRTTGRPTGFAPQLDGPVFSLAVAANRVYAGSGFSDPQRHRGRFAWALNGTTGNVLPWRPMPPGPVQAVAIAGRRAYLGGSVVQCPPGQACQFSDR
jgi:hypothetical protein